jgi:hypothetical protein
MSRSLRGRAAPSKKVEAEPAPLVASEPEKVAEPMPAEPALAEPRAVVRRGTVKKFVEKYKAEIARRNAPMVMGAPPAIVNVDVATGRFAIGNARAETVALGKNARGVFINNYLSDPNKQPEVFIGEPAVNSTIEGSYLSIRGDSMQIVAIDNLANRNPQLIEMIGNVELSGSLEVNGLPLAGVSSPSYIEAWTTAADVGASIGNGAAVPFPNLGANSGTVTYAASQFTIPRENWGTYEVTWRVSVLYDLTGQQAAFALRLVSGALAFPDAGLGVPPQTITRTAVGLSLADGSASVVCGQAYVTVAEDADADAVISLVNNAGNAVFYYDALGNPASIMVRRVSQ